MAASQLAPHTAAHTVLLKGSAAERPTHPQTPKLHIHLESSRSTTIAAATFAHNRQHGQSRPTTRASCCV